MKYLREYDDDMDIDYIRQICKRYNIQNWSINTDYFDTKNGQRSLSKITSIDVNGSVDLSAERLTKLPLIFRNVSGYFSCAGNNLTTLEGCPQTVDGFFTCYDNQLESLKGCPRTVRGPFYCHNNQLTSLEGAPDYVGGEFFCHNNKIRDIYSIPSYSICLSFDNGEENPVYSIVRHFIDRADRRVWIDLFNELDIIQDGYNVILDRLKYFYEGTKLNINVTEKMLDEIKSSGYKIIN